MSNVKDRPVKITLDGTEYDLVFNLNVYEVVLDEYKTIKALVSALMGKDNLARIKASKTTLKALIDEAVDSNNENQANSKRPRLGMAKIGRLLKPEDLPVIVAIIMEAITRSLPEAKSSEGEQDLN